MCETVFLLLSSCHLILKMQLMLLSILILKYISKEQKKNVSILAKASRSANPVRVISLGWLSYAKRCLPWWKKKEKRSNHHILLIEIVFSADVILRYVCVNVRSTSSILTRPDHMLHSIYRPFASDVISIKARNMTFHVNRILLTHQFRFCLSYVWFHCRQII